MEVRIKEKVNPLFDSFRNIVFQNTFDISICYKKYERLRDYYSKFIEILESILDTSIFQLYISAAKIKAEQVDINTAIAVLKSQCGKFMDVTFTASDIEMMEFKRNAKYEEFQVKYKNAFSSALISYAKSIKENLHNYREKLGFDINDSHDESSIDHGFIGKLRIVEFWPLYPLSKINYKSIYTKLEEIRVRADVSEKSRDNIEKIMRLNVTMLSRLYQICKNILDLYYEPEYTPDRFAEIILNYVDEIESMAKGCDGAIKCIKRSMDMFKERFPQYYRSCAESGENTVFIMKKYLDDLMEEKTTKNRALKAQFMRLIVVFKKLVDQNLKKISNSSFNSQIRDIVNSIDKGLEQINVKLPEEESAEMNVEDKELMDQIMKFMDVKINPDNNNKADPTESGK